MMIVQDSSETLYKEYRTMEYSNINHISLIVSNILSLIVTEPARTMNVYWYASISK